MATPYYERQSSVPTKRPSLREAVEWIALNDAAGDDDPVDILAGLVSVVLVAALFGKEPIDIARRVYKHRHPEGQA